jgi:RNA polymerase sigma-70 factor (ECF subfamily)
MQSTAPAGLQGPGWDWAEARRRCLREARRFGLSGPEAEDVVQEALLRAWRHSERHGSPDAPVAWFLTITRNEALRRRERDPRRREVGWEERDRDPAAPGGIEEVPARVDVRRAMSALPADDRRLLYLRYAEDLTQPEVARAMRMPEGTAKVRLHRLRNHLRALLVGEQRTEVDVQGIQ